MKKGPPVRASLEWVAAGRVDYRLHGEPRLGPCTQDRNQRRVSIHAAAASSDTVLTVPFMRFFRLLMQELCGSAVGMAANVQRVLFAAGNGLLIMGALKAIGATNDFAVVFTGQMAFWLSLLWFAKTADRASR